MTPVKIPKNNTDLRRHILRRDLGRVLGFLLWVAVLIGGAVAYNNNHQTYPDYRRMVGWRMALWVVLAVFFGFFIFRMWKFFTDRPCVGTVVTSGLSHSYTPSPDPGAMNGVDYDFRTNTALRVRLDSGKLRRLRFEQKPGFYLYYHEGERVAKLRGLPYPVNLDPTAKNGCVCSACGAWRREKAPHCEACGMSLIDPEELI